MKIIDPDHPFYRPLWVRLLIVGSCAAWTVVEYLNGQHFWGLLFLAAAAYSFSQLILFYKPTDKVAGEAADKTAAPPEKREEG